MATTAQQQAFISSDLGYATAAAQATGNSPAEVLGQWALETGWGTNYAGNNNPGNVMSNGVAVNYPTMGAGVSAYVSALKGENVTGMALNPQGFASALQSGGYGGTQSNYGQSVLNTINAVPASVNNQYGNSALNNLSSTNTSTAEAGMNQLAQNNPNVQPATSNSPCAFSISNPMPWMKCQGSNILFILFGLIIVAAGIIALISSSTKNMPLPVPE